MKWLQWLVRAMLATVGCVRRYAALAVNRRQQAAQGLVEYGLILVLIAIVAAGAVSSTGSEVKRTYSDIECGLSGATGKGGSSNSVKACNSTNPGHGKK